MGKENEQNQAAVGANEKGFVEVKGGKGVTSILDAAVKSVVAGKNPGAYDGGGKKGGFGTPSSEEEKKKKWVTHPITKTNSFVTLEREWDEDTDEEGGVKDNNSATGTKMVDDEDEDVANNTTRGVSTAIMSGLDEDKERKNTAEGAVTDGTTDERKIARKSNDSVGGTKADVNANDELKPNLVSEHWRECLPLIPLATRFEPRSDDHGTMCTTVMAVTDDVTAVTGNVTDVTENVTDVTENVMDVTENVTAATENVMTENTRGVATATTAGGDEVEKDEQDDLDTSIEETTDECGGENPNNDLASGTTAEAMDEDEEDDVASTTPRGVVTATTCGGAEEENKQNTKEVESTDGATNRGNSTTAAGTTLGDDVDRNADVARNTTMNGGDSSLQQAVAQQKNSCSLVLKVKK